MVLRWASAYWLLIKLKKDGGVQGGVEAEIKEDNLIELKATEGVAAVALYLNDRLIDTGKPVRIVTGGRELYRGPVKPEIYVELASDHQPYWQDRILTRLNPFWKKARKWPEPGQPFPAPKTAK